MSEKLLSLARECGATQVFRMHDLIGATFTLDQLTAFAAAIREEERERCAKLCDGMAYQNWGGDYFDRYNRGVSACAAFIRSSGTSGRKSDE